MSLTDEFRKDIEKLLSDVQSLLKADAVTLYPMEYDEHWENEVWTSIWNDVVRPDLLSKTPVDPPQLNVIADQIRGLPLIRNIPLDPASYLEPDHVTFARDLEVLAHKLREMLEHLPPPVHDEGAGGLSHPERHRGPKPDMARHRKIAEIVELYGQDWKQESNLTRIADQLDQAGVAVRKSWTRQRVRTWSRAVTSCREEMVKAIDYSRLMAQRDH